MLRARQARDEGMRRVIGNAPPRWPQAAYAYIRALPAGSVVTGEIIRRRCLEAGIVPHHPNAWGAIINASIKRGILVKTGRYVQPIDVKSHARMIQVLRRA